ncbi:MAG TPA: Gfo/Idh/MocA family oxidoreductase, partial [bacterium]|nr:Gfo/Idh/MocA family oxidoreductase [bacterium]
MYKIGLIGCGGISPAHIEGYLAIPERVKITAICDILQSALDKTTEKIGPVDRYDSYDEMIAEESKKPVGER